MARAVIIGGTGQIGVATGDLLLRQGWEVVVLCRSPDRAVLDCEHLAVDARDEKALSDCVRTGTDLLLSAVAFDGQDAACLAAAGQAVGRIVAISSASVFRDVAGRTLDEAAECGFPAFPCPLDVDSPTVDAGPETYSTRKIEMERTLLARATAPVTILRPCAVHGAHSKHAREWWFVKRLLDGREVIPLAYGGQSRFQTTSAQAIARAVLVSTQGATGPIETVSDSDSPSVAEIGWAIMDQIGLQASLIGLPDSENYPPKYGATAWSLPRPMVVASSVSVGEPYATAVSPALDWLARSIDPDDWQTALPQLAGYTRDHFDYARDDAAVRLQGGERLVRDETQS